MKVRSGLRSSGVSLAELTLYGPEGPVAKAMEPLVTRNRIVGPACRKPFREMSEVSVCISDAMSSHTHRYSYNTYKFHPCTHASM